MRDACNLLVTVAPTVIGGNGVTLLEIVAATDAAMTTPVQIKATPAVQADANGDYVVLECTDADLQAVSTDDLRYAAARITMATGTDEAVVTYIAKPKRAYKDLTVTTIA